MRLRKAIQISCLVYKTISGRITEAMKKIGALDVHVQSGRVVVPKETSGLFGIGAGESLDEEPSELFRFYAPGGSEDRVMRALIDAGELSLPGRGSIIAETVATTSDYKKLKGRGSAPLAAGLSGISCIVQRGQCNAIVRAVLGMGFCVPHINYGGGTGLRDKLGLLRITIPAEKDEVHLIVAEQDVDEVMNVLIDAGKLDQPGKGFIYNYPVSKGLLNTKLFRGKQKHAASVEQMISAIDDIEGSTEWRKRSAGPRSNAQSIKYIRDLVNVTVICNEGHATDFVRAALNAGAAGATISKLRYLRLDGKKSSISRARELGDLAVSKSQADSIVKAIVSAGVFGAEVAGAIELKPVPKAYTYLGANR